MPSGPPRIEVGRGSSLAADALAAGREAASAALAAIRTHSPSMALLFASARYELGPVVDGVREILGPVPVVGASSNGEIFDADQGLSVTLVVIASPELTVHVAASGEVSRDWRTAVDRVTSAPGVGRFFDGDEGWLAATRAGRSVFGLLFLPGCTSTAASHGTEIVDELVRRTHGQLQIFGGSAADLWTMERNSVVGGDRAIRDGMALAVVETSLRFGISAAHGYRHAGEQVHVTCGDMGEVELDGRPARERVAEIMLHEGLNPTQGYPALVFGLAGNLGEDHPLVLGLPPDGGPVKLSRPLPTGAVLHRLRPATETTQDAGAHAIQKAILRGSIVDPVLTVVATCPLRPFFVGATAREEVASMRAMLGATPLVGFRGLGEVGVCNDGATTFMEAAISVLVLGGDLSHSAVVARENELLRRDIESQASELRVALDRLTSAEAKHRTLFENMADLAWVKDTEGRYVTVNPAFSAFSGRSPEEYSGRTDWELFPERYAEILQAEDSTVFATGEPLRSEDRVKGIEGGTCWLEKSKAPIRDERGFITGIVGIARDVTVRKELEELRKGSQEHLERLVRQRTRELEALAEDLRSNLAQLRRTQETLRESEEKYRMMVRGAPNSAVFLVDRSQRCSLAEGTLLERLEADPDHLVDQALWDAGLVQRRVLEPLLDRAFLGQPAEVEALFGKLTMLLRVAPFRGVDGAISGALLVATDMTERRKLEEQVRQSQKMEAVGRLAAGVAHDFNNLLTLILGSATELFDGVSGDPKLGSLAREVVEASHRAASLTRQLMAFSRQEAVCARVLELNAVVRGFDRMLRRLIGEDVDVCARLHTQPLLVRADPSQLEQVLLNLVVNSRDAMQNGGRLTIETHRVDRAPPSVGRDDPELLVAVPHVVLSVSDTGHGMEPEVMEHIFEPFFTTKEFGRGTGLGLATVFGIVRQSGGTITVYSEPGVGTTFNVYLPQVASSAAADMKAPAAHRVGGTEPLLVVEDDSAVRGFICRALEEAGHAVIEATGPGEALKVAADNDVEFDLLVTDVVMPGMGGSDLADRLLVHRPGLRILFISGYTENAALRSGTLPPGRHFLQKPFTGDELARAVRAALDSPGPVSR